MGNFSFLRLIPLSLLALNLSFAQNSFAEADDAALVENRPALKDAKDAEEVLANIEKNAIDPNKAQFKSAVESCKAEVLKADQGCAASQNPNAQAATQQGNQYAQQNSGTGGGSGGQGARCGDFGGLASSMMDLAKAFKGQCDGARTTCEKACKTKIEAAEKSCASIPAGPQQQQQQAACKQNAEVSKRYGDAVKSTCRSGYAPNSMDAGKLMGLASSIMGAMQKCQEDVADTSEAEKARQCAMSTDPADCTRSDTGGLNQLAKKMAADAPALTVASPETGTDGEKGAKAKAAAGGLPYAPGGGGVSANGKSPEAKADAPAKKGLDTNIYAGDQGGGGGRAPSGGGYPDAPESVAKAIKKADELKNGIAAQFTGSMGRSNWQKVKEASKNTSPTLILDGSPRPH